jgi:N-acetylglucosamine malate deacetylase 1
LSEVLYIFAPHPDDEILGCGGTIAKKLCEKNQIFVVFMTDGRAALKEQGLSSGPTPLELKEIRKIEAYKAAKIIGLKKENLIFFDVEDGRLKDHRELIQTKVVSLFRQKPPTSVFFPQEFEISSDHRETNNILKKAILHAEVIPSIYEYSVKWPFPLNKIEENCPCNMFDSIISKMLRRNIYCIDITMFLPLKKKALEQYESQLTKINPLQKKEVINPRFVNHFLRNIERFFV